LGDFSLLNDLPRMYRAYEKVASPDEKGVIDFLGDYLLGGKDLLGHNKHDKTDKTNTIQFRHATSIVLIICKPDLSPSQLCGCKPTNYTGMQQPGKTKDYHSFLLRPPLT
jgi:hypothetical protein